MILVNTVQNHKKHKEILLNLIDEFAGVNDTRIYDLQVASSVQTIVPNMTSDWSIEKDAKREVNTMPQWAGSSWYWLRFIDPDNDKVFADKKKLKNWLNQ